MTDAEQISDLLLHWEELREQGQDPSAQELARDHPELIPELERRMRILAAMYRVPNGADDRPTQGFVAPAAPAPPDLEQYEILEPLGSGGMGKVYKARQVGLQRLVALKMVLAGYHATPQERDRFRAEAEAVARLDHPNIVRIYEIGEKDGCPYLALEYVEGGSLDRQLHGKPMPPLQAARLVQALAGAIDHAHRHNIIHRDLKPANILLCGRTDGQSVLPEFVPKIADFGLAKCLDNELARTQTGAVLGTPSYMAPEQAEGQIRRIGPATDIYALGAILYELLTGHAPFHGTTLLETLEQVRSESPSPPRREQAGVPADLETICLKCLEKEPEHRYPSAQALQDDLTRFLDGEPILARSRNLLDRLGLTLNRVRNIPHIEAGGTVLLFAAPMPFLAQLLVFLVAHGQPWYPLTALLTMLGVLASAMGLYFVVSGEGTRVPFTTATRHLWSLRLGLLLGLLTLSIVHYLLTPPGTAWNPLSVFPLWAATAGIMFFSLGGLYWGRLYLLGLCFFALALLMPLRLDWAPPVFGAMMTLTISVLLRAIIRVNRERAQLEGKATSP
jgi:serine/threonine protein kinase